MQCTSSLPSPSALVSTPLQSLVWQLPATWFVFQTVSWGNRVLCSGHRMGSEQSESHPHPMIISAWTKPPDFSGLWFPHTEDWDCLYISFFMAQLSPINLAFALQGLLPFFPPKLDNGRRWLTMPKWLPSTSSYPTLTWKNNIFMLVIIIIK